jgi:hypothetical protein
VCDDLTGWPTDTGVDFITFRLDSNNEVVAGTQTTWVAVVSGNSLINLTYVKGATDTGNAINDVVMIVPSSDRENDLATAILTHTDQDGTLKAGAVDVAAVLANDVVETAKIKDGNVTTAKLAAASVTGDKITTYRTRLQSVSTDTTETSITIQEGWSFITGTGTSSNNKVMTFPTPFTSIKSLKIGILAARSGSDPVNITDLNIAINGDMTQASYSNLTNTGFTVNVTAENGRTLGSGVRYGFWWEVKGVI